MRASRFETVAILAWALALTGGEPAQAKSAAESVPTGQTELAVKSSLTADEMAAERAKLIAPPPYRQDGLFEEIMTPEGDYLYEVDSAKPLVSDGVFTLEKDQIVKGLSLVRAGAALGNRPDPVSNAGVYWKLKGIREGGYWIGVLYHSSSSMYGGKDVLEAPQATYAPIALYLNGRIVQWKTHARPVQVAPGVWFTELLAGEAEHLKAGDELAVVAAWNQGIAKLILHSRQPELDTPWRVPLNFGGHQWNLYTALGLNIDLSFQDTKGRALAFTEESSIQQSAPSIKQVLDDEGMATASLLIANPLPIPMTVDFNCIIRTHYSETAAVDKGRVTLLPHTRIRRPIRFKWQEGELTYRADCTLKAVKPPAPSEPIVQGGLGWPKHEVYSYFPGQRQLLPWPDPHEYRVVRRATLALPYGGARQTYGLDGSDWEMGYTTELEPPIPAPAGIAFKKARVPQGWTWPHLSDLSPRPHGAYFRKTLNLPDDIAGRSFKLAVDHVYCEATAYVNGHKCGNVRGEDTPLICDITKAVKPGTNELVVVVRDLIAIMNPDYVNKQSPVPNGSYLDAPGLHGGDGLGIGSVEIHSAPVISSEDVFIETSVRNQQIAARITAANRGTADARVLVTVEVLDDGKPIFGLGKKELTLKPNQPVEISLAQGWKTPELWGPGNPHLYATRVTIADAGSGRLIDVRRDRFGFRESWIDGPSIMFNGYPIKPVGYAPLSRFSLNGNYMLTRGGGRDWLDELGILGYRCISGLRNTPSQHNVENDTFWKTAEDNNIAALKKRQNSPHLIAWDISNEWLCFLHYSTDDVMAGARRFKALSDAVRKYDPTRWTLGNSEGDFCGLLDNHSLHYAYPYNCLTGFGMDGHSSYLPDDAFWRPLTRHIRPGEEMPLSPHSHDVILRPDKKVIMDTEFLWKVGGYMPPWLTSVTGEDDVVSPAVDSSSAPIAWLWKTLIDGHRDLGMSLVGIHCSFLPGVTRGGHLEQTFVMPENQHRAFSGRKESRRFTLINSRFHPSTFDFRWSLCDREGQAVRKGKTVRRLKSGELYRGDFSFTVPEVDAKATFTLKATLETDGVFACGEEWDVEVWPDQAASAGKLERTVVLFDPSGKTAKALGTMQVAFRVVATLGVPDGVPEQTLLVIGENALDEFNVTATGALAEFAGKGGRIMVLRQNLAPKALPVNVKLESRFWESKVFVRAGSHPLMEGLSSYDLHFWQPDRSVCHGAYTRPTSGAFTVLADGGSALEWCPLLELYNKQGAYLLCQLPLVAKADREPMAREFLRRMVGYAAGKDLARRPDRILQVVSEPNSAVSRRLRDAGAASERLSPGAAVAGDAPVLLDAEAARKAGPQDFAAWRQALTNGATLVVSGAVPEDQGWLSGLAGSAVKLAASPFRQWDGRGYRSRWSRYTAGLSQMDVYWKRYANDERAGGQAEQLDNVIEPLQDFSVTVEGARDLVFPGALVELDVGKGVLLIDQRRWHTGSVELMTLAVRNLSALLTGLNVFIEPYIPPKDLPKDIAHRTIDLTPYANRGLVDDIAEDGKGGWSDQGARADLRSFPTGRQILHDVPFQIGEEPKVCIVLACKGRPGADTLPTSVAIPVGYPVEGLYFLHGAAYSSDNVSGVYKIKYADGSFVEIPLKGEENICDWASPHPLMREKGTTSIIAWTGRNEVFSVMGLYRMLWVNPRPDLAIKEVEFYTPERKSVPILVGLTAAVKGGSVTVSPETAAKIQKLMDDGKAALKAGRLDDARQSIKGVIALDPAPAEACRVLVDIAEKKGEDDWVLDACRLWVLHGARSPTPHNRMGEILEKRKDLTGALAAYRKSLQTEWNQPPVIEAVKRLETKLK